MKAKAQRMGTKVYFVLQSLNNRNKCRAEGTESYGDSTTQWQSLRENGKQPPLWRTLASELPNKTKGVGALSCMRNLTLEPCISGKIWEHWRGYNVCYHLPEPLSPWMRWSFLPEVCADCAWLILGEAGQRETGASGGTLRNSLWPLTEITNFKNIHKNPPILTT